MRRSAAEQLLLVALSQLVGAGELTVVDRIGERVTFTGLDDGPSATVVLKDPRGARRIISGGLLGVADGYLEGWWDTPDLDAVLELGVANIKPDGGGFSLSAPLTRAWHRLQDNNPAGSKRNIEYHYDLGNEFYRLMLDPTMTYSCGIFDEQECGLSTAQEKKWDALLDLLQPSSRDHLLEIGCGWGGFAIHAAQKSGCKVTGITLSNEQYDWAVHAVREADMEGRVEIRLQDYRDTPEQFTGIASIEMFEAVGERWWPVFFKRVEELLAPGGTAAIQTITIDEARYEDYRRNPDFIQRYVFPGGQLPSPQRFESVAQGAGLSVSGGPYFYGQSYARTLEEWSHRFEANLPAIRDLGFDERFIRLWRYYLSYCRAGFRAGTIDVMQVQLSR